MKLQIVPFDVAKDLKELGVDWKCMFNYERYNTDNIHCSNSDFDYWMSQRQSCPIQLMNFNEHEFSGGYRTKSENKWSAPEQSIVVKWFRDIHDIHIQPTYVNFDNENYNDVVGYRLNVIFGERVKGHSFNYLMSDPILHARYYGGISQGMGKVFTTYEECELEGIELVIDYLKTRV